MWPTWRENPLFTTMVFLMSLSLIIFLGWKSFESMSVINHLDQPDPVERYLYMEGIGKSTMVPDIATMMFSISTTSKTVAEAQNQNTTKMNAMIEKIKAAGVVADDLQTKDYSAYEKTEWNQEKQISVSVGWVVSQTLQVKIRETKNISTIIEIAGQNGSTSIGGPTFSIDDSSKYESVAREDGLMEAKQKAEFIAESLGLSIDRAIGYSEYKEEGNPPIAYMGEKMGGSMSVSAPEIAAGTQELKMHVNVTYLLK